MPISTPDFYTGAPLDSSDLRYRDEFIDELWEALQSQHVLLTAPRRTGKTSIMDHLYKHPQGSWTVVKENVQDLNHPADFFLGILSQFYDEHPKFFRDKLTSGWQLIKTAFDRIENLGVSEFKVALRESDPNWQSNWKQHGLNLMERIRAHETNTLIIIDELPDMLLNMREDHPELLQPFVAWLRKQRLEPHPKNDPIRWLVGGSVNLSSTLDNEGMVDLINDFDPISLPILTEEQVKDFVTTMLTERGIPITDTLAPKLTEVLGRPIPLFMQLLTQDLYRDWKKEPSRTLDAVDVETAFTRLVRSSAAKQKLQHYYSRLKKYYLEPNLSAAHEILSQLSLSANGISRRGLKSEYERHLSSANIALLPHELKQRFNQLLLDLENDFYIEEIEEDQYDFASGVLKSWWKKYYA